MRSLRNNRAGFRLYILKGEFVMLHSNFFGTSDRLLLLKIKTYTCSLITLVRSTSFSSGITAVCSKVLPLELGVLKRASKLKGRPRTVFWLVEIDVKLTKLSTLTLANLELPVKLTLGFEDNNNGFVLSIDEVIVAIAG